MRTVNIEANVRKYFESGGPSGRCRSFDYCFNYFQSFRERDQIPTLATDANLQLSCLHLGFYLASWGMLRSRVLRGSSVKYYERAVKVIAACEPTIWKIDANCYDDTAYAAITELAQQIRGALHPSASNTLVTKIMLGVFGCVPAFDSYFNKGFGATAFDVKALKRVAEFYMANANTIEKHRDFTLDFNTEQKTCRLYSRAKVIDMIFWIEGRPSG